MFRRGVRLMAPVAVAMVVVGLPTSSTAAARNAKALDSSSPAALRAAEATAAS